jgi:hypothetical protein
LCGHSADSEGVSEIKRKVFKVVAGKKFDIVPLALEFLLSILLLIMDNMEEFQANSFIHTIHTSHKHDLHRPKENGASFAGIIIIQGKA